VSPTIPTLLIQTLLIQTLLIQTLWSPLIRTLQSVFLIPFLVTRMLLSLALVLLASTTVS
jgi:hypothetical protein